MTNYNLQILQKLNLFIEGQLDKPDLSIEVICEHLGLSRTHLHRVLVQSEQPSLSHYIRNIRLAKAAKLLQASELRITEICDAVGISSPQNFSKYFSQTYGLSPSEFRKKAPAPAPKTCSIAVLPFSNLSNDEEQEYFSDGITDELINVLSRVSSMKVVGRSSSFSFKGQHIDIRKIGTELGVGYLLEGSVRRSKEKLRITAQLTDTSDGYQVWSQKYDNDIYDIFDVQDEISLAILEEIEVKLLGKTSIVKPVKHGINNPEAYELYLKGKYHFNKFAGPPSFEKSIEFYKKAILLEPDYAAAYAGIASSYLSLWFYRFLDAKTGLAEIKKATQKANEIDQDSPESILAQARMEFLVDWNFETAEASFLRSIELSPNVPETHVQYALMLAIQEKSTEALKHLEIGLKLDPLSLFNIFYGQYVYWLCGDLENATLMAKKLLELEPGFWGGHSFMGMNLFKNGNSDEGIIELEIAKSINYSGFTLSALGAIYGFSLQKEKALEVLTDMKQLSKNKPVSNYDFGIVYASLGEIETACNYFENSIEKHEPSMLFFKFVMRDWLKSFQDDTRFVKLMNKLP